jgi:GH24 family phage-related lysozyme (muramidase)
MQNRFLEMEAIVKGKKRTASRSFSTSNSNWSVPMAASDRVLIVLIENGGVDLGIPELVDRLIQAIPGASTIITSSIKQQIVNAIREKLRTFTDNLLEGAELALNRYRGASPSLFGSVIVLRNSAATYNDLKTNLIRLTRERKIIDLVILTHGSNDYISVEGGVNAQKIRDIKTEAGQPLSIRSVYMMNCVGSSLNQAWIDAGAKVSSGSIRNNYLPEPTTFFYWNAWKEGQGFEAAVTGAYRRTINVMNEAVKSIINALPIPGTSALANRVDFSTFDFVRDSAPVVQGMRTVTISTDNLSFTQSAIQSNSFATTVLPLSVLDNLYLASPFTNASNTSLATSQTGINMIKEFEGFRANKYNDAAGHCTIGYGTLLHHGNCNNAASEQPYNSGISETQAAELLTREVRNVETTVKNAVTVSLNQNQFDALVSFTYNVGSGNFSSSTLLKELNKGNYSNVPSEMRRWTKATVNGQKVDLPGLVTRRNREAELFATAVTAATQSVSWNMSAVNYQLSGPIDMIRQPTAMTCWAAVMTMMVGWRRRQSMTIPNALATIGQTYVTMFNAGQGLSATTASQLYLAAGLVTITSFNPTIQEWERLLRTYGPLYVDIGFSGTNNTHAIIVTGISGDGTATGTNITFIDPALGQSVTQNFGRFLQNYEAPGAVSWPHVIVHWPAAISGTKSIDGSYSQPFYDTGEHAILGSFISAATTGALSNVHEAAPTTQYDINGVQFTYGQIMTLGDFYDTYNDLARANAAELRRVKTLVERSEQHYTNTILHLGTAAADVSNSDWIGAIGQRYLNLALANNSHFAPRSGSSTSNNQSMWQSYHRAAIEAARRGVSSDDLPGALKINAFGDHFLTDAFSAGHLFNKEHVMNTFISNVIASNGSVNAAGDRMLERVADGALAVPSIRRKLALYEVTQTHWYVGFVNFNLDTTVPAKIFYRVLKGILEDTQNGGRQQIANLSAKAAHDYLNHYNNNAGVPVRNSKGDPTWNLTGDGTLNQVNINMIQKAVKQSILNISDAVTNPSTPLTTYYQRVWDYTPNLSDPTTAGIVNNAITKFTDPNSSDLINAAVSLLEREIDTLLSTLLSRGIIRRA